MPVYFVAQVDVHDRASYERYMQQAATAPAPAGMKLLAIDDRPTLLEGKWHGPRTVILEFPSEEAFRSWYDSPAYQAAAKLRWEATTSNAAVIHGVG
jgi:uncharacterized protein (DUF1330 family)